MPTPPKPYVVLKAEGRSHRTKAELMQRKKGEDELTSGVPFKERNEVRLNKLAHREFTRVRKLLKGIEKNDALYEPVVNRYCLIQAECVDLVERREELHELISTLRKEYKELDVSAEDKANIALEYASSLAKMVNSMMSIDKIIATKRKMLLDIEKECAMTIAAALRTIPKKPEQKTNALLKALGSE